MFRDDRKSRFIVLVCFVLAVCIPLDAAGQGKSGMYTISDGRNRVVFPASGDVDSRIGLLILRIVDDYQLRGVPPEFSYDAMTTVSFAVRMRDGRDAVTYADQDLIVLPLKALSEWSRERLSRVLRHEMAHLVMASYLDGDALPAWFDEGFAEWSIGGLSCMGEARIRVDMASPDRSTGPPDLTQGAPRSRLSYDYFATIFEYMEWRIPEVIERGELLARIKAVGLGNSIRQVFGVDLDTFLAAWNMYLRDVYDGVPSDYRCE